MVTSFEAGNYHVPKENHCWVSIRCECFGVFFPTVLCRCFVGMTFRKSVGGYPSLLAWLLFFWCFGSWSFLLGEFHLLTTSYLPPGWKWRGESWPNDIWNSFSFSFELEFQKWCSFLDDLLYTTSFKSFEFKRALRNKPPSNMEDPSDSSGWFQVATIGDMENLVTLLQVAPCFIKNEMKIECRSKIMWLG